MNGKRLGFTLIELLIVVAIIAILAAIAVPNFLEAQTRAKVARVKNDFRTLATAIEAYSVDWNRMAPGLDEINPASATALPAEMVRLDGSNQLVLGHVDDARGLYYVGSARSVRAGFGVHPFGCEARRERALHAGALLRLLPPHHDAGLGADARGQAEGRSVVFVVVGPVEKRGRQSEPDGVEDAWGGELSR